MSAWVKAAMAVAVMVVPGAFLMLFTYATARAIRFGWMEAHREAKGQAVPLRAVFAHIRLKQIVRDVRLAA